MLKPTGNGETRQRAKKGIEIKKWCSQLAMVQLNRTTMRPGWPAVALVVFYGQCHVWLATSIVLSALKENQKKTKQHH